MRPARRSLPSRERELKLDSLSSDILKGLSLPSRERELKHCPLCLLLTDTSSLPSRERELKPVVGKRLEDTQVGRSLHGSVN